MFRIKKSVASESEDISVAARPDAPEEAPLAKAPPRRPMPIPARPIGASNLPIDIPRRAADLPSTGLRAESSTSGSRENCLVVGKGVQLKGEIFACERLMIDGEVELQLAGSGQLQIGTPGSFRGTADIMDADVAGRFTGDLIVRGRLTVRPTGRIQGNVRYAQIVIEAGGQVDGALSNLGTTEETEPRPLADAAPPPIRSMADVVRSDPLVIAGAEIAGGSVQI